MEVLVDSCIPLHNQLSIQLMPLGLKVLQASNTHTCLHVFLDSYTSMGKAMLPYPQIYRTLMQALGPILFLIKVCRPVQSRSSGRTGIFLNLFLVLCSKERTSAIGVPIVCASPNSFTLLVTSEGSSIIFTTHFGAFVALTKPAFDMLEVSNCQFLSYIT